MTESDNNIVKFNLIQDKLLKINQIQLYNRLKQLCFKEKQ